MKLDLKDLRSKTEARMQEGFIMAAIQGKDVLALIDRIERLTEAGKLLGSFAPKGPVPDNLGPAFYHTLSYDTEVILQQRIDAALAELEKAEG